MTVRSAFELCEFVDDLAPEVAGELDMKRRAGMRSGAVYVDNGRVCWAAAAGLSRRLSDLLAARAGLGLCDMESLYGRCKEARVPLGEFLVRDGLLSPEDLREALIQHSAESLAALCSEVSTATWTPRSAGAYSSRFTFSTSELLSRTCAEQALSLSKAAGIELEQAFRTDEWAAAFVRGGTRAAPVPIAVFGQFPETVTTLARVGKWAASALDVASTFQDAGVLVTASQGPAVFVTWRFGEAIIAGKTDVHGSARLLNRRAKARRSRESDDADL